VAREAADDALLWPRTVWPVLLYIVVAVVLAAAPVMALSACWERGAGVAAFLTAAGAVVGYAGALALKVSRKIHREAEFSSDAAAPSAPKTRVATDDDVEDPPAERGSHAAQERAVPRRLAAPRTLVVGVYGAAAAGRPIYAGHDAGAWKAISTGPNRFVGSHGSAFEDFLPGFAPFGEAALAAPEIFVAFIVGIAWRAPAWQAWAVAGCATAVAVFAAQLPFVNAVVNSLELAASVSHAAVLYLLAIAAASPDGDRGLIGAAVVIEVLALVVVVGGQTFCACAVLAHALVREGRDTSKQLSRSFGASGFFSLKSRRSSSSSPAPGGPSKPTAEEEDDEDDVDAEATRVAAADEVVVMEQEDTPEDDEKPPAASPEVEPGDDDKPPAASPEAVEGASSSKATSGLFSWPGWLRSSAQSRASKDDDDNDDDDKAPDAGATKKPKRRSSSGESDRGRDVEAVSGAAEGTEVETESEAIAMESDNLAASAVVATAGDVSHAAGSVAAAVKAAWNADGATARGLAKAFVAVFAGECLDIVIWTVGLPACCPSSQDLGDSSSKPVAIAPGDAPPNKPGLRARFGALLGGKGRTAAPEGDAESTRDNTATPETTLEEGDAKDDDDDKDVELVLRQTSCGDVGADAVHPEA